MDGLIKTSEQQRYRVILIDDEIWALRGLKGAADWSSLGFDIIAEFTDSAKALDEIRVKQPDLIFTDIRMPGMDGMTLIRTLKEEGIASGVVIVTAYKDFEIARQAFKHDVCDYLIKPLDKIEVTETLKKIYLVLSQKNENCFNILNYDLADKKNLNNIGVCKFIEAFQGKSVQLVASDIDLYEHICSSVDELIPIYLRRYKHSYISVSSGWQKEKALANTHLGLSRFHTGLGDFDRMLSEISMSWLGDFRFSKNDQTAMIQEYLFINMAKKLTMDDISSVFFLSKPYLFELFRHYCDTSAMSFLKNVRLSKAASLLRTTDLNIKDIAESVGFDDNSYFTKQFKIKYSCTPEQYAAKTE